MTAHPIGMHKEQGSIQVDPRMVFLARASARHFLVERGEMDLAEAFDGLVQSLTCSCAREMVERWELSCRPQKQRRRK
jgi:hypothetical protein